MASDAQRAAYSGKRILITGGLGFIGSSLAVELSALGADVLLVDSMLPGQGGNLFNIDPVQDLVRVNLCDQCDETAMRWLVRDRQFIFNLAGSLSHTGSLLDPYMDLRNNCRGHLSLLEACRKENPAVKIIYSGTRSVYGAALRLPVNEDHPCNPRDVNGVHSMACEAYHFLYARAYGLRATCLRLSNVYGPRQQMKHSRQGFLNWFIRCALEDDHLPVFGDGAQVRDFNYVDDVVEAFLVAGSTDAADGQCFNVGCQCPLSVIEIAREIVRVARAGRVKTVPYPSADRMVEVGDYYSDYSKIRDTLGWQPRTPLEEGLQRTIDYYRLHRVHYFS